ncbi:hypothetical protein V2J09_003827 [Rumex salicifolius]
MEEDLIDLQPSGRKDEGGDTTMKDCIHAEKASEPTSIRCGKSRLPEMIQTHDPTILVLLETHISGRQANKVCMKIRFDGLIRSKDVGFNGGIWVLWRRDRVSLVDVDAHDQVISLKVNGVGLSEWIISAIYASPNPTCREELCSRLLNFSAYNKLQWMMIGDFNETRFGRTYRKFRFTQKTMFSLQRLDRRVGNDGLGFLKSEIYLEQRGGSKHKNYCSAGQRHLRYQLTKFVP